MDGKIVHLTDLSQLNPDQKKERLSVRRKSQDNVVPHVSSYTEFVLYMENQGTVDANFVLSKIAKRNKYDNDNVMAISLLLLVVFLRVIARCFSV